MKPRKTVSKKDDALEIGKDSAPKKTVRIHRPVFGHGIFHIRGTAPLVINKFSQKALREIRAKQVAGSQAEKGTKRDKKDFEALYEGAKHISRQGWCGIQASAFRNAMISACKVAGFAMTRAKLSVFTEADGYDRDEGTPLVRITKGQPRPVEMAVRNADGSADIRIRPMWDEWEAVVRIRFDVSQFDAEDVANLMMIVGTQVGVGEGRPDSKKSAGMGWGLFELEETK